MSWWLVVLVVVAGGAGVWLVSLFVEAMITGVWILWQTIVPDPIVNDGYPFRFLLFLGNIAQLLLMPPIKVGQNVQGRAQETQASADFETNVQAENEMEAVLMHLKHPNALMIEILRRLELDPKGATDSNQDRKVSDSQLGA